MLNIELLMGSICCTLFRTSGGALRNVSFVPAYVMDKPCKLDKVFDACFRMPAGGIRILSMSAYLLQAVRQHSHLRR